MNDRRITGTALVTGASQGIGAVFARKLAQRGHDLLLVARNRAKLDENAAAIRSATGRPVDVLDADLSIAADVEAVVARIRDDASISVLINNAGASLQGGWLDNDASAVSRLIALNITAPALLAHAAAKAFVGRGEGAIVNVSSVTAFIPERFDGVYSGSKAFLINLTIALAGKLEGSKVRAQAVLPGPTDTDMWARGGVPESVIPRSVIMNPEDLVDAALVGLDRGEVVTLPTVGDENVWKTYEAGRNGLGPHLAAGSPAPRYRVSA